MGSFQLGQLFAKLAFLLTLCGPRYFGNFVQLSTVEESSICLVEKKNYRHHLKQR